MQLPECRNKRGGHNAVTVGEEIWTLGGWDNVVFQDTAEVYDSRASRWRKGASMKTAHAYFAAAHLHGELFALGGMSERTVSPPPICPFASEPSNRSAALYTPLQISNTLIHAVILRSIYHVGHVSECCSYFMQRESTLPKRRAIWQAFRAPAS